MNVSFIIDELAGLVRDVHIAEDLKIAGFSIDTRTLLPSEVFVALQGDQNHGNAFAEQALDKGAAFVLTDVPLPAAQPHILVSNALDAITVLAKAYRNTLTAKVVAITGSVGKTSVKEGLSFILSQLGYKTHASIKSYNNHIGVPLTVLNCSEDAQFLIVEMGMNHPGEIKALTQISQPHVAVVTAVGPGHIEFFNSVKDIANEKVSICEGVVNGGTVVLPFDSEFYSHMVEVVGKNATLGTLSFGANVGADIRSVSWGVSTETSSISTVETAGELLIYTLPSANKGWLNNSLAMIAVLRALKVNLHEAAALFETMPVIEGRGQIHNLTINGTTFTLIDDAYNANPMSMAAALETLAQYKNGRKIAVLGDMRELGGFAKQYHTEIGQLCNALGIDRVITCGQASGDIFNQLADAQKLMHCNTYEEVEAALVSNLRPFDVVLFKASNGVKLHAVVGALKKR